MGDIPEDSVDVIPEDSVDVIPEARKGYPRGQAVYPLLPWRGTAAKRKKTWPQGNGGGGALKYCFFV